MPKVAIIILDWNGWPDTEECLRSLQKLDYPDFEIILIDNGSKQRFPDIGSQFDDLRIIQVKNEKNLGFTGGNNQGIEMAMDREVDYVLLLNNDTVVESDFLSKMLAAGEADKRVGMIGPVIYDYNDRKKIQSAGGKINWLRIKGEHEAKKPETNKKTGYLTGCCLLVKREVIEKIGGLDEDYFLYYEDTDWNLRAQKAGYDCVLAVDAKIYHKGSTTSQEFSYPYIYYHTRNGLMFGSRFGFKPLVYLLSFWIYVKQLLKLAIGYKRDWAKPVIQGIKDFWAGKTGKLEGYY